MHYADFTSYLRRAEIVSVSDAKGIVEEKYASFKS
jgi:hypothetical protein